jgi:hypothetical protein
MSHSQQFLTRSGQTTEMLAQLALCLLNGGQLPSSSGVATVESAASATTGTSPVQLTVRADQVKAVGAGRRPASLVGRQVTVTLVATVVAEHENGTLSVTVDEADRSARRPRGKRAAKKSPRTTSKRRSRSTRKRPTGRRATASQAKEGTA